MTIVTRESSKKASWEKLISVDPINDSLISPSFISLNEAARGKGYGTNRWKRFFAMLSRSSVHIELPFLIFPDDKVAEPIH